MRRNLRPPGGRFADFEQGREPNRMPSVTLVKPNPALLGEYEAALAQGWSPQTTRDVSGEHLEALRRDRDAFLRDLLDPNGVVTLPDGRRVPRLPFHLFWIVDDGFCGQISFRFQPGTDDLPDWVSGHVGYAIVPWKRRRGYATTALGLVLPLARAEGLARVCVTCDDDNEGSRRAILAHGGVLSHTTPLDERPGRTKLHFWIATPEG
jgi:predicted acetyltransferase